MPCEAGRWNVTIAIHSKRPSLRVDRQPCTLTHEIYSEVEGIHVLRRRIHIVNRLLSATSLFLLFLDVDKILL